MLLALQRLLLCLEQLWLSNSGMVTIKAFKGKFNLYDLGMPEDLESTFV